MDLVCKKLRQHRERLRGLLERGDIYYDARAAEMAVWFIENHIRHWKSPFTGLPFKLSESQKNDLIKPLFGFKWRESGLRVFTEVYLQVARKYGKSSIAAAILITLLFCGGAGSQYYCAATKKDQARLIFEDARNFIKNSPALKARAQLNKLKIEVAHNNSTLEPLSADENSLDGLNVAGASIDEVHKHKTPYVHDVLVTATGSRTQPLILNVTTAGDDVTGVGYQLYEKAERVLNGSEDAPAFFPLIFEADAEVDWKSEEAFQMANPNYPITPNRRYFVTELQKAISNPRYRPTYFKYSLNRWVQTAGVAWLDFEKWKRCGLRYTAEDLRGCRVWLGIDMSKNTDLSSIGGIAELSEERWSAAGELLPPGLYALCWNFLPGERIEDVDEREAPYKFWVEQGWITVCGGASIDIDQVGDTVLEIAGMFDVVEIGVDRNRTGDLIRRVEAALGRPVILVNQTMTHISEPAKELERLVGAVELHHNNNGCLNWQVGCVKVRVNGDQIKPIKGHDQSSGKRIDAIYALVDAIYARMNGEAPAGSVYEERGMICL